MKLHHQLYFDHFEPAPDAQSTVVVIPGLFGSVGNWRSFAKQLSQHVPVVVVDQRNHGLSPHSDDNSYFDLAGDISELLDDLNISKATICGHSMGGKTAMVFALTEPDRVDKLIVLDIAPVEYSHSHAPILEALKNVDLSLVSSRAQVDQQLTAGIPDKATRMFIMLSLANKNGEFSWRLNVDALYDNLKLIGGFPTAELQGSSFGESCLFVKGGNSNYVKEQHRETIEALFPSVNIQSVKDAGHWLHIDQPQQVIGHVLSFLEKE